MADKQGSVAMRSDAKRAWERVESSSWVHAVCDADRGVDAAVDLWWRSFQDRERMRAARAAGWCGR